MSGESWTVASDLMDKGNEKRVYKHKVRRQADGSTTATEVMHDIAPLHKPCGDTTIVCPQHMLRGALVSRPRGCWLAHQEVDPSLSTRTGHRGSRYLATVIKAKVLPTLQFFHLHELSDPRAR